jgi:chemotaxis response regulator CheB
VIRVLVIDDHPVLRAGLESVLRAEPGFICMGAVATRDACPVVKRTRPDIVLGTRGPLVASTEAIAVVDDARDLPALFDRLRLAVREDAPSASSSSPAA